MGAPKKAKGMTVTVRVPAAVVRAVEDEVREVRWSLKNYLGPSWDLSVEDLVGQIVRNATVMRDRVHEVPAVSAVRQKILAECQREHERARSRGPAKQ